MKQPEPSRTNESADARWLRRLVRRHFLIKLYHSRKIFWIVRCNVVVFPDIRCLEFTLGLVGVGIMFQIYYGKNRDIAA